MSWSLNDKNETAMRRQGKSNPGKGIVHGKILGQHHAWCVRTARRPVCLEQSEQGEEREKARAEKGQNRLCQAL